MKKTNRILSLILACLLVIGTFPIGVFATETADESEKAHWTDEDYDALYVHDADGDGKDDLKFKWDAFDMKEGDTAPVGFVNEVDGAVYKRADNSDIVSTAKNGYLLTKSDLKFSNVFRSFAKNETYEGSNVRVLQDSTWEMVIFQNTDEVYEGTKENPVTKYGASLSPLSLNLKVYNDGVEGSSFIGATYGVLAPIEGTNNVQVRVDTQTDSSFATVFGNPRGADHTFTVAIRYDYTIPDGAIEGTLKLDFLRDSKTQSKASFNAAYDARYKGNFKNTDSPSKSDDMFTFGGMDFGYRAMRIYDVALTEEQLRQNHTADLLSFYRVDLSQYHALAENRKKELEELFCTYQLGATSKEALEDAIEELALRVSYDYSDLYITDADGDGESDLVFKWDAFSLSAGDGAFTEFVNQLNSENTIKGENGSSLVGAAGNGYVTTQSGIDFSSVFASFAKSVTYEGTSVSVLQDSTWEMVIFQNTEVTYEGSKENPPTAYTAQIAPLSRLNLKRYNDGIAGSSFIGATYGLLAPVEGTDNVQVRVDTQTDSSFATVFGNPRGNNHTFSVAIRHDYTIPDGAIEGTLKLDFLRDNQTQGKASFSAAYDARYKGNFKKEETPTAADNRFTFGGMDWGYRAIRIYAAALSEEQLCQNHVADLFAYYHIDPALFEALTEAEQLKLGTLLRTKQIGSTTAEEIKTAIKNAEILPPIVDDYTDLYVTDADGDGKSDLIFHWDGFDLTVEDGEIDTLVNFVDPDNSVAVSDATAGNGYLATLNTLDFSKYFQSFAKHVKYEGQDIAVLGDSTWEMVLFQNTTLREGSCRYEMQIAPTNRIKLQAIYTNDGSSFIDQTYGILASVDSTSPVQIGADTPDWGTGSYIVFGNERGEDHTYALTFRHDFTVPEGEVQGTVTLDLLRDRQIAPYLSGKANGSSFYAAYDARYKSNYKVASTAMAATNEFTFGGLDFAYRAIRIYDVALTEAQMRQNHAIDLFKYYGVDVDVYRKLDYQACERLYDELDSFNIGHTSKEELEAILANFALTGGVLGLVDVTDYLSFLGIQTRIDEYAAIRLRYLVDSESLSKLDALGAGYSFGVLYAKKKQVASKDDLSVVYNPGINEFVKGEGNYTVFSACSNGEFNPKLNYLDQSDGKIDFGVMLPPVALSDIENGEVYEEYYVRGYLAVYLNGSYFILYLDTDDGVFGESVSIAEVCEHAVCNGYASAPVPSLLTDDDIKAGAQASEDLYRDVYADYQSIQSAVNTVNGAYAGALVSNREFLKIDDIMASVNMGAQTLPISYALALEYALTAATAHGELNIYCKLGTDAYAEAKELTSCIGAKAEARYDAVYAALVARGVDESTAEEKTLFITQTLQNAIDATMASVGELDSVNEALLAITSKLELSHAELKLQKIINASSSLFIEGTTVSRYTILTDSENLAAAQLLQRFFLSRQGAFVGIYQVDNKYVSGVFDFTDTKAIYVGMTDRFLSNGDTFAVYYDEDLSSLCIEGKDLTALTAGATAFLHTFCVGSGRIRISAKDIGTSLVGKSYLSMYEINTQKEFPKINISSYDATGVMEGFMQRLSEQPDHVTVVSKLESSDYAYSEALTFYVATDGDDANDGSFAHPFATVDRALEAVAYCGGATIRIRGGTYTLDAPIKLTNAHSGTASSPLFITSYEGEEVIFTTGKTFSGSAFTKADQADFLPANAIARLNTFKDGNASNVYVLDLTSVGLTKNELNVYASGSTAPGLYVGDAYYRTARYPNADAEDETLLIEDGFIRSMHSQDDVKQVGRVTGGISSLYHDHKDDPSDWWEIYIDQTTYAEHLLAYDQKEVADKRLWVNGSIYEEWDDRTWNITLEKTSDGKNYIKSTTTSYYGVKYQKDNTLFFYNMLEDLDSEGECLVDVSNMLLYVYAKDAFTDSTVTLCTSSVNALEGVGVENAVISGINFERIQGYGVKLVKNDHTVVQDCIFRNFSDYAVLINDCTQSGVTYSEFYACNGIDMTESTMAELIPTRNFVQNNRFTNAGDTHAMTMAVYFSGVSSVVSHNYFLETRLKMKTAYECIIEYNEFERGSQYVEDNGPIYVNDSCRALHIRYNYLHGLNYSLYGIYLDDMSSGDYVYGNVIHYVDDAPRNAKCVNLHNGSMNVVWNNICIGSTTAAVMNNINYYAVTVNGVSTGGGGLAYRWEDIVKNRLSQNGNFIVKELRYQRFPMYSAYTEVVDRSIAQMNENPSWDYANKLSPHEDDELYVRTPLYNVYKNNLFFDCASGLEIPKVGYSTAVIEGNVSLKVGTEGIFKDAENGDYTIPENSVIYDLIPEFVAPDMSKMGVLEK